MRRGESQAMRWFLCLALVLLLGGCSMPFKPKPRPKTVERERPYAADSCGMGTGSPCFLH